MKTKSWQRSTHRQLIASVFYLFGYLVLLKRIHFARSPHRINPPLCTVVIVFSQQDNTKINANSTFGAFCFPSRFSLQWICHRNEGKKMCFFIQFVWLWIKLRVAVPIVSRPTLRNCWWFCLKQMISLYCVHVYLCMNLCVSVCFTAPLLYSNRITLD